MRTPIGAIRLEEHGDGSSIWILVEDYQGERRWLCAFSTAPGNRLDTFTEKDLKLIGDPQNHRWLPMGVVPGSPAYMEEN